MEATISPELAAIRTMSSHAIDAASGLINMKVLHGVLFDRIEQAEEACKRNTGLPDVTASWFATHLEGLTEILCILIEEQVRVRAKADLITDVANAASVGAGA